MQRKSGAQSLMAVETISPVVSVIVQLKNECGHKLRSDSCHTR